MKKRLGAWICAVLLLLSFASCGKKQYTAREFYAQDGSNVLSATTENHIVAANQALQQACGAEIVVATVDFTGAKTIDEYALDLFNKLEIGDKDKNNGVLLLFVIEEDNYWCLQGAGLERTLPTEELSAILQEYAEPDFDAGNYDAAALKTFDKLLKTLQDIYGVENLPRADYSDDALSTPRPVQERDNGIDRGTVIGIVVVVAFMLLVILAQTSSRRRSSGYTPRPRRYGYHSHPRPPRRSHMGGHGPHYGASSYRSAPPRPSHPSGSFGGRSTSHTASRPSGGSFSGRTTSHTASRPSGGSSFRSSGGGMRTGGGGSARGGGAGRGR